jgi:hypothetical protein
LAVARLLLARSDIGAHYFLADSVEHLYTPSCRHCTSDASSAPLLYHVDEMVMHPVSPEGKEREGNGKGEEEEEEEERGESSSLSDVCRSVSLTVCYWRVCVDFKEIRFASNLCNNRVHLCYNPDKLVTIADQISCFLLPSKMPVQTVFYTSSVHST